MNEPLPRVIVAMLGARMHYAVPRLLHEAGLLERFFTDSYVGNKPWLDQVLKAIPLTLRPREVTQWLGRTDEVLPPEKVTSFELLGLWYAIARRRATTDAELERVFAEVATRFGDRIGVEGIQTADVLWGFNGASLALFRNAKARAKRCILEQTILPRGRMQELLKEEDLRWPNWERQANAVALDPIFAERDRCEEEEWELADRIVVGSDFVRSGLIELGVPDEKVRLIPYGVDLRRFPVASSLPSHANEPLRILFAGEVGLRKGVPDLLHAIDRLPQGSVELRLAGAVKLASDKIAPWRNRVAFLTAVPRSEMQALYAWADIFVLPSIVEGSATVTYEALMSGVPVITTPNAGSIVRDGIDGFVVPIRNPEALADAMSCYLADRGLLARHRAAARHIRVLAGLERYCSDLVTLVDELSTGSPVRISA